MSEHNFYNIARQALLEKDPNFFTIDLAKHAENTKKMLAERDKNTPPPAKVDLRKEYNDLRQKLFNLTQDAKCFEIRCNEAAGRMRLIEHNIQAALKSKKECDEAGNLRGARNFERNVQTLEAELVDATTEFEKNKKWSGQAARALKDFNGHARIEELKAILEQPLPEVKR